jgi:hypothetical protein
MFCEPYRKTLSAAALRGEALPQPVEAHLAGCLACRRAFAEEQALLGSVDSGLRSIANAAGPASLVPRVRARIAEAPAAAPAWRLAALGFLAAALALIGMAAWLSRAPRNRFEPAANVGGHAFFPAASPATGGLSGGTAPRNEKAAGTNKNRVPRAAPVGNAPAVLVSPEEREGFERYLASLSRRRQNGSSEAAALANDVNGITPLEIIPLAVKELTTEPLASGESK